MNSAEKPLVRAVIFIRDGFSFAFFDQDWESEDLKSADWEGLRIKCRAAKGSLSWYRAAYEGCLTAYRRLQARHPDKDLVLMSDELEIGLSPARRTAGD